MPDIASVDADALSVYALRFAHREASARREHFYRSHDCTDEAMPIDYYVWLIAGRGRAVVVDTGFSRAVAEARGSRDYLASPAELLDRVGVAASRVDHVVITHLHYDHTGTIVDFAAAAVHVQRRELDYWRSPMGERGDNPHLIEAADHALLAELEDAGRLVVHDGDAEPVAGVHLHLVGGHTQGLQVVEVSTPGGAVVLASDATHFYDNIRNDRPYSIVDHLPSMYGAFDLVNALAASPAHVVPGHDPLVLKSFPAVAGLEGLVVRVA